MRLPGLCRALFGLALLIGGLPAAADPPAARPQLAALVVTLEDGRSCALGAKELGDRKGGAVFWGDWAVTNLLMQHYLLSGRSGISPAEVARLWWAPGRDGERPALLLQTAAGPVDPFAREAGTAAWPGAPQRPRIAQIRVVLKDGRALVLGETTLRDERSGVLLWNDYAVANFLVPFYLTARGLPTSADDAMRFWNSPTAALAGGPGFVAEAAELPAFIVKPRCIPGYPGLE